LIEALVLAALGGAAGAGLSLGGVRVFKSAIPDGILSYWFDYSMDTRVFAALVAVSFATAFVFGLVPALQASRTDVNHTLKDGSRTATGNRGTRAWTAAFLSAELALAMVLMAVAAIGNLASRSQVPTDSALETTPVMTTAITLPTAAYPDSGRRTEFLRELQQRLLAHPEIAFASRTTFLPLAGASSRLLEIRTGARAEGQDQPTVAVIDIAPGYFETLDLMPMDGREFLASDGEPGQANAIVNERFAQVYLAGKNAVGAQIAVTPTNAPVGTPPAWLTIVGVSPSVRIGPGLSVNPVVYLPIHAAEPSTVSLLVRHRADPSAVANMLRSDVLALDANIPLYRMRSLGAAINEAQWNPRVSNYLMLTVTVMSMLLAMVGLYAVTAQSVARRTREIGLRVALGARAGQISREIFRSVRIPLGLGLLLGVSGALAWDRAFSSGLVDTYAASPRLLLTFAGLLTTLVGLACFVPLRKAIGVNPLTALRHE
jgi:putative ABC transport system permease protein